MQRYNVPTKAATRAALQAERRRVRENPNRLGLAAFRGAQFAHAGLADYGETWDALFIAATTAGVDHLAAQETIGRQFRIARIFPLVDVSEVAA